MHSVTERQTDTTYDIIMRIADHIKRCPPISPNPNSPNPISPNRYTLGLGIGLGLAIWLGIGLGSGLGIGIGLGMGLGIGLGPGFNYFRQYNVIRRIGIRRNGAEPIRHTCSTVG